VQWQWRKPQSSKLQQFVIDFCGPGSRGAAENQDWKKVCVCGWRSVEDFSTQSGEKSFTSQAIATAQNGWAAVKKRYHDEYCTITTLQSNLRLAQRIAGRKSFRIQLSWLR